MKTIVITVCLFFAALTAIAQKNAIEFGKIEKADLEIKQCEFEKDASALVLFDIGRTYCYLNYNSIGSPIRSTFEKHKRIKILSKKGMSEADVKIILREDDKDTYLKKVTAQTYNLDAQGNIIITKVEKDAIYKKKLNKKYKEVVFTFPEVKIGSVIEFKYTLENSDGILSGDWYFQGDVPVQYSQYTLDFPSEIEVTAVPDGIYNVASKKEDDGRRSISTFSINNLPSLKDEPYMSNKQDYLTKVTPLFVAINPRGAPRVPLIKNWVQVINALYDDIDFGDQLTKNIPRTSELDVLLANVTNPYEKMKVVHNYVRNNMVWDGYYSIWALDGVKSAWKDKKGTVGEINLILVNLLKDIGIEAYPVLVSTKKNGLANATIADIGQFNKVMAYVELDKVKYVLDASEKITPTNLIPEEVVATYGLVVNKIKDGKWGWRELNNTKSNDNNIIIQANLSKEGKLEGKTFMYSSNYSKIEKVSFLKENKSGFEKYFVSKNLNDIKVDSLEIENEKDDEKALLQKCKFSSNLNLSSDYYYMNTNLFTGIENNPFTNESRISNFFFGYRQKTVITANITLDEGVVFEELPKNMKMITSDTGIVFSRVFYQEENLLSYKIEIEYKKTSYTADEYEEFMEFHKKMYAFLKEQLVIKKVK